MTIQKDLIIDVGLHSGKDTEFYLRKGFRVAAIEANPLFVKLAYKKFAHEIEVGRLKIYPVAIAPENGQIDFYVNQDKDDWSTVDPEVARRSEELGTKVEKIQVEAVRFADILAETGIPYYAKIDIEGADMFCIKGMFELETKPTYISMESELKDFETIFHELATLWNLGYRQFKIVNQALNETVKCPNPPVEGKYVDMHFDGHMSGPFGAESPGKWLDIEAVIIEAKSKMKYQKYFSRSGVYYNTVFMDLVNRFRSLARREPLGWYDFHAKQG